MIKANIQRHQNIFKNEVIPLIQILITGSKYNRTHLKTRLLKEGLLENRCYECNIGPEWNAKLLTLQLDHINGDRFDNRLENLRLLCPNCHTQTETFAGRRLKQNKIYICPSCNGPKKGKNTRNCIKCLNKIKVELPNLNQVLSEVFDLGYEPIGRKYGLTGNAVKKRLKKAGLVLPSFHSKNN